MPSWCQHSPDNNHLSSLRMIIYRKADAIEFAGVMSKNSSITVLKIGFWSAALSALFSISYCIAQLAEWLGWLGSKGGPENASTALGLIILLTPSLFLGLSFSVLMVSIHYYAAKKNKIWSHIALVFASIYATLISINYFVQLTLVVPHLAQGYVNHIQFLLFIPFDSFLYSVDILGYSFMSLSTFFAAFVFSKDKREKAVHWFLLANGFILPFISLQNYIHALIWPASLWAITFPGATIVLARLFSRSAKER
jgi:hypothetical protein